MSNIVYTEPVYRTYSDEEQARWEASRPKKRRRHRSAQYRARHGQWAHR